MDLAPLTVSRASNELAAQLRLQIRSGELAVGRRLPPQRELAATLEVGRQAVQEALAILEAEGYIETRRGAHGGSFVCEPVAEASFWRERLEMQLPHLSDVMDFRIGVERQICELAAVRRTDEDLLIMSNALSALPDGDVVAARRRHLFREADSLFHMALARAGRNRFLEDAVRQSRSELFLPTDQLPYMETIEVTKSQHSDVLMAVADRDGRAAADAMSFHIDETRAHLNRLVTEVDEAW